MKAYLQLEVMSHKHFEVQVKLDHQHNFQWYDENHILKYKQRKLLKIYFSTYDSLRLPIVYCVSMENKNADQKLYKCLTQGVGFSLSNLSRSSATIHFS